MNNSPKGQTARLAVDRILKDNLPKTCAAANISMSTCSHSFIYACLGCSALMGNKWTPGDSLLGQFSLQVHCNGEKKTKKKPWLSKEAFYSDAYPREITPQHQKQSHKETQNFLLFIFFQSYLSVAQLTRLMLKGNSSAWKKLKIV